VRRCWVVAWVLVTALAACRGPSLPEAENANREAAAGRRIFERKCASCHNHNGDGRTIVAGHFPNANLIDGIWRGDGSPASIEKQIRTGHDPMPKFEGKLSEEEIRQTVAYVVALSRDAESRKAAGNGGRP
jgi:mono/diheme cytochrome c family protein